MSAQPARARDFGVRGCLRTSFPPDVTMIDLHRVFLIAEGAASPGPSDASPSDVSPPDASPPEVVMAPGPSHSVVADTAKNSFDCGDAVPQVSKALIGHKSHHPEALFVNHSVTSHASFNVRRGGQHGDIWRNRCRRL